MGGKEAVRLYDYLLTVPNPAEEKHVGDFKSFINPKSLETLTGCRVEPGLKNAAAGKQYQFERLGYFCVDPDSHSGKLVFNRTVTLRDEWAKIEKEQKK